MKADLRAAIAFTTEIMTRRPDGPLWVEPMWDYGSRMATNTCSRSTSVQQRPNKTPQEIGHATKGFSRAWRQRKEGASRRVYPAGTSPAARHTSLLPVLLTSFPA